MKKVNQYVIGKVVFRGTFSYIFDIISKISDACENSVGVYFKSELCSRGAYYTLKISVNFSCSMSDFARDFSSFPYVTFMSFRSSATGLVLR